MKFSGLGEALAHTFYMAGCKVVLAARRQAELDRVKTDLLEMHSVGMGFDVKFNVKFNVKLNAKINILHGIARYCKDRLKEYDRKNDK